MATVVLVLLVTLEVTVKQVSYFDYIGVRVGMSDGFEYF
jgi:hypothetical protein